MGAQDVIILPDDTVLPLSPNEGGKYEIGIEQIMLYEKWRPQIDLKHFRSSSYWTLHKLGKHFLTGELLGCYDLYFFKFMEYNWYVQSHLYVRRAEWVCIKIYPPRFLRHASE